jgi:hypothetical protein
LEFKTLNLKGENLNWKEIKGKEKKGGFSLGPCFLGRPISSATARPTNPSSFRVHTTGVWTQAVRPPCLLHRAPRGRAESASRPRDSGRWALLLLPPVRGSGGAHLSARPRHQGGFPFLVLLRAARRWPRDFMERSICSPHLPRQQTTRFPLPLSFDSDSANAYKKKSIRRNSLVHPVRLLVGVRP